MTPQEILQHIYEKASETLSTSGIENVQTQEKIEFVCKCLGNRAGVRLLMSCMLGKVHNPDIDPRNPYTEIGGEKSFSGRTYDERYLTPFITKHRLPCNPTTAFLTPTLRNHSGALTTEVELVGRPRELYRKTLELLEDVSQGRLSAEAVLVEVVRILLTMREENQLRMSSLIEAMKRNDDALPLSSEAIVTLMQQHLACKNSSRLPVLIVAAAYQAAGNCFGETHRPLLSHNAADLQTGSFGDIEICLVGEESVVTSYEMKMKRVTVDDIDVAATKISRSESRIDNYIFITTDVIEPVVSEYAATFYEKTGGTEIAVLDCIGFIRHFLHLFHRSRKEFLKNYQALVLIEPDSAVSQSLKEAFLALRKVAETGE
jgi:hypothetical protein